MHYLCTLIFVIALSTRSYVDADDSPMTNKMSSEEGDLGSDGGKLESYIDAVITKALQDTEKMVDEDDTASENSIPR